MNEGGGKVLNRPDLLAWHGEEASGDMLDGVVPEEGRQKTHIDNIACAGPLSLAGK